MGSAFIQDNRVAADTEAIAVSNSTGTAAARDEAVSVTGPGVAAKDNGMAIGGSGNRNIFGGVEIGGANSGSIIINDTASTEAVVKKFTETLAAINDSAGTSTLETQKLLGSTVSDALEKITSLSESKQTEGITSLGRLALWGLGIILAGVLVWKWSK
jgi:hypothetical protein